MSYSAILEYLQELIKYYPFATRSEKTAMLNHAQQVTDWDRKSLLRRLNNKDNRPINGKKGKCGTKRKYPPELLIPHIKSIRKIETMHGLTVLVKPSVLFN